MDQQSPWSAELNSSPRTSVLGSELQQELQWEGLYPASDPRWLLARRIAASSSFCRSTLLSNFLLYVCDRALSGKTDEISEHQIGVNVFGRKPGYNPSEDNIVRSYARHLRQRLDQYFETEGKHEDLRLSIPRGKYVPHFESNVPLPSPARDEEASEVQSPYPHSDTLPAARRSRGGPSTLVVAIWVCWHRTGLGCVRRSCVDALPPPGLCIGRSLSSALGSSIRQVSPDAAGPG